MAGAALCEPRSADFATDAAQHFVNLKVSQSVDFKDAKCIIFVLSHVLTALMRVLSCVYSHMCPLSDVLFYMCALMCVVCAVMCVLSCCVLMWVPGVVSRLSTLASFY